MENDNLTSLPLTQLNAEKRLEDWIEQDSTLLDMELLFIGRQVNTPAGPIDLLALDCEGNLVVLELKRDKTPREVVAQALDYASCIHDWPGQKIVELHQEYAHNKSRLSLGDAFKARFGASLPEQLNQTHSIIIVASRLDDSSERIVNYLQNELGANVNAIFFNVFKNGEEEIVARSWLTDPEQAAEKTDKITQRKKVPTGFKFVNVGDTEHRDWIDCQKYGFVAAGAGIKAAKALQNLSVGDKIFAYMKGKGYVGYGIVKAEAVMAKDFSVNGQPLLSLPLQQPNFAHDKDDPELSEYVAAVDWHQMFDKEEAVTYTGIFANQNIVCYLYDHTTADFLRQKFGI